MASPGGWVQVVAVNHLRRVLRRSHLERMWLRRQREPPTGEPPQPDAQLWAAVQRLPHRQRTAVVLRIVGDLSEPEIASSMGISRGTVSSTLQRALARLRLEVADTDRSQEALP